MGGSSSNCCGSRPGLQIPKPEDPDSGIIGRKRRFQNLDSSQLIPQQSYSQDSFYDTSIHHQTHTFHITGNITVSSNINDDVNTQLPYGITVNINGLQNNNNNNNKNIVSTPIQKPHILEDNAQSSIELKQPIINGLINVKNNNENIINYNNNYTKNNWIENYNKENENENENESTEIDTSNDNEINDNDDDDNESIISYLSNAPTNNSEYENENKYDLDCMHTLILKNINNENENDIKVRKGSNSHLFNVQNVQNWNKNDMEQLEMEMLKEMRRLSANSSNIHSNIQQFHVENNLSNIN